MARDTKIGMLLGLGIILLVGIFVSDYLRPVPGTPGEAATGFAGAAMDRGREAADAAGSRLLPDFRDDRAAEARFLPSPAPAREASLFSPPPPAWRATSDAEPAAPSPIAEVFGGPAEPLLVRRAASPEPVLPPALGARGGERSLLVQTGDTLAQVAFELYGDTRYAEALADANPHAIDTTGRPVPGATLIVPDHAGLVAAGRAQAPPAPPASASVVVLPPPARDLRPATPAAVAAPPAPRFEEVTVGPGDNLSRLASRHLGDPKRFGELYEANRDRLASADDVRIGMKLRVPVADDAPAAAPSPAAARPASTSVAGVARYTVQPNDSLSRIAGEVLGDPNRWEELYQANRDLLDSPNQVKVGQQLRVPG